MLLEQHYQTDPNKLYNYCGVIFNSCEGCAIIVYDFHLSLSTSSFNQIARHDKPYFGNKILLSTCLPCGPCQLIFDNQIFVSHLELAPFKSLAFFFFLSRKLSYL